MWDFRVVLWDFLWDFLVGLLAGFPLGFPAGSLVGFHVGFPLWFPCRFVQGNWDFQVAGDAMMLMMMVTMIKSAGISGWVSSCGFPQGNCSSRLGFPAGFPRAALHKETLQFPRCAARPVLGTRKLGNPHLARSGPAPRLKRSAPRASRDKPRQQLASANSAPMLGLSDGFSLLSSELAARRTSGDTQAAIGKSQFGQADWDFRLLASRLAAPAPQEITSPTIGFSQFGPNAWAF